MSAPRLAGAAQRGLVPPSTAWRRRIGMAAPGDVVHRDHEAAPAATVAAGAPPSRPNARRRSPRARGALHGPRPASGAARADREALTGRPKAASGSSATRRPAGQERELDPVAIAGARRQPTEEPARVGADAAGHAPTELLDGQEHRSRRPLRHEHHPLRRGRAARGQRRSAPTRTGRTRRHPPPSARRAATRPRGTRPALRRARHGRRGRPCGRRPRGPRAANRPGWPPRARRARIAWRGGKPNPS